jgi:2-methylcitrate dehydratase PrpD
MRISLKFYSCVASNHTSLDAIRAIKERRPFTLDELDKIVIRGSQVTVDHVGWPYRPEGLTSAQLNLPFCVATLLLEGDVFVDQFEPEAFTNPIRMELSKKVEVVHDPAITALGSKFRHKVSVEVHLKDGTIERETRELPRGGEDAFAPASDIIEKFKKLSRATMSATQQADLIDMILNMESMPDMRRLPEALRTK